MIVCVDSGELAPIDFLTFYLSVTSASVPSVPLIEM